MPIRHRAVNCGVLTHRRDHDRVAQLESAEVEPVRFLRRASSARLPCHRGTAPFSSTFAEIEIYQRLVRNLELGAELLEITDCYVVEPDGHRPLELRRVGISRALGKVIFASHYSHRASYWARSDRVVLRAEINRMTESPRR